MEQETKGQMESRERNTDSFEKIAEYLKQLCLIEAEKLEILKVIEKSNR